MVIALATLFMLSALIAQHAAAQAESADKPKLTPSGTITIDQTQVALLFSGNAGGGTLSFQGKQYEFSIGGLGIGGIGISKITATGTVYNLTSIDQFAGTYGQARWGYALGEKSKGKIWLEKTGDDGDVIIHLSAQREGLALSLGGDLVRIKLK